MQDIFEAIIGLFTEHWVKVVIGAIFLGAGWAFGWWRARHRWLRKEFLDRVNFSLNTISDGRLVIRTLMEKSCEHVFLNPVAVTQILRAAKETTVENPIIPLPQEEYWFFLNAALNEVSEKFANGFMMRDIGAPVRVRKYLLCLTNECDGDVKTRKIRVMLIQQQTLEKLPKEMPELESPNHATRWKTIQIIASRSQSHPHEFMTVEVLL